METNRLNIRKIIPDDWPELQKIAEDFRESPYALYDMPLPTEKEKIRELTARFSESGLFFAVFLKNTTHMIGYVCFHEKDGKYDLGYCFHSAFQGKGYAFESCVKAMEYLVSSRSVCGFTAGTALKNLPSCKLLKKLGFILTETETLAFRRDISFEGGIFIRDTEQL